MQVCADVGRVTTLCAFDIIMETALGMDMNGQTTENPHVDAFQEITEAATERFVCTSPFGDSQISILCIRPLASKRHVLLQCHTQWPCDYRFLAQPQQADQEHHRQSPARHRREPRHCQQRQTQVLFGNHFLLLIFILRCFFFPFIGHYPDRGPIGRVHVLRQGSFRTSQQ